MASITQDFIVSVKNDIEDISDDDVQITTSRYIGI